MISPSKNNATEVASLQNDRPFLAVVHSLRRHSRIPSTGNCITVMEVFSLLKIFVNSLSESCVTSITSAHEPVSPVEIGFELSNYTLTDSSRKAEFNL